MINLYIKPLSVNQVWKGRRFKTQEYKQYEKDMMSILPPMIIPKGKLKFIVRFGFSSKACDWDNPVKPLQDILSKAYGFNDKNIYKADVEKIDVEKGEEFIKFEIVPYLL